MPSSSRLSKGGSAFKLSSRVDALRQHSAHSTSTTSTNIVAGVAIVADDAPQQDTNLDTNATTTSHLDSAIPTSHNEPDLQAHTLASSSLRASDILPPTVKLSSGLSYAQVISIRAARSGTSGTDTSDYSDSEFHISPYITSLPRRLDSRYRQKTIYAAIRKPSPADAAQSINLKRKLLLDHSDTLHKELCRVMLNLAPDSVLSSAPSLGILCALDPYYLDQELSKSTLSCIFSLTLVWPAECVPDEDIQTCIFKICSHGASAPIDTSITYKTITSSGEPTTCVLPSRVAFASTPSELFAFASKPPAATLTLTVSFPFQCPQDIIDEKLSMIAFRLWKKPLTTAQLDEVFVRAYASVDPDRPLGRITNTFHARFGFPRAQDPASCALFTELCMLHCEFKLRKLDAAPNRTMRMSSLSFSFITDKGPKRQHSPPDWFESAYALLKLQRPELFVAASLGESSAASSDNADTGQRQQPEHQPHIQQDQRMSHQRMQDQQDPQPSQQSHEQQHRHRQDTQQREPQQRPYPCPWPMPIEDPRRLSVTININNDQQLKHLDLSFMRYDYGQYVTLTDGSKHGNCCAALCLSEATALTATQLVEFFHAKARTLADVEALFRCRPGACDPWSAFTAHDGRKHLAEAFSFGSQQSWAANYTPGQPFDNLCLLSLTPFEVRNMPIVIISDESILTQVTIEQQDIDNRIILFPPLHPTSASPPLFLLHRATHFTVLKCTKPDDGPLYYSSIKQLVHPLAIRSHLPDDIHMRGMPVDAIIRILCNNSSAADLDTLIGNHSLLLRMIEEKLSLDRPAPLDSAIDSKLVDAGENADRDGLDLLSPQRTPRSTRRSTSPSSSPAKSPSIGSTPPRDGNGIGRSARSASRLTLPQESANLTPDLSLLPSSPASQTPSSPDSIAPSSATSATLSSEQPLSSFNSETDLGALVSMHCGRNESRFAARVGVRGFASSDETSISGSLYSSGRSPSPSQTPSIFSTGSFHPRPIPSDAPRPTCEQRHRMQFGRFTEDNHRCDGANCKADIARGAFGWHCEQCSFDICANCHYWQPDHSQQSSLDDSISTLQLHSQSPQHEEASLHQKALSAAAAGRGRNA